MSELMSILLSSNSPKMQAQKNEMEQLQREQMNKASKFAKMVLQQRKQTVLPLSKLAA
jgi:ClpP class serine protease